jgi:hypothetical protein
MKKYFLVYNDNTHANDLERLLESVRKYSDFEIIIYHKSDISLDFIEKNRKILEEKRGGGYWLWKPYIIWKTLDDNKLEEDDLLFYMDSKYFFLRDFEGLYLDKMRDRDILAWKNKPNEPLYKMKEWCKMDVIQEMGIYDAVFKNDLEIGWAGAILFKKNENTIKIVKEWLDYCCDYHLLTDSPSLLKNDVAFVEHRHDQSILSAILFLHGIPMEFFECNYLENMRFPFDFETVLKWYHMVNGIYEFKP